MQLPETRFVAIDGGNVSVRVTSAAEARHALKELRLVRREAQRHRRELARAAKSAAATAKKRPAATKRKGTPHRSAPNGGPVIDNPLSYVWHSLAAVADAASGNTGGEGTRRRGSRSADTTGARATTREIARTDKLISGIDACLVQIEARLLNEKAPSRRRPTAR